MSLVALCNNLDYFRKATTDTGISLIASDLIIRCWFAKVNTLFFDLLIQNHPSCKADIRNPLRYLLMNAVASRSVSGSFQLPLT